MKISAEKLQEIIESHGRWLRNEEGGERANLRSADLSSADLSGADLSGADLSGADLRSADLSSADLYCADLSSADLSGADLRSADLRSADLRSADLDKTYYQVVRVGSRRGITTYCVDDDNVLCGCWNGFKGGTLDEFKTRVESVYGREGNNPNEQYYDEYMAAITFFAAMKEMK
jgi:hypothetical protein